MTTRLNLTVDDDVPAMLAELAGGERKRGAWLSAHIRALYETQSATGEGLDVEGLRLQLLGLAANVRQLEARVMKIEQTLAAMMAATA